MHWFIDVDVDDNGDIVGSGVLLTYRIDSVQQSLASAATSKSVSSPRGVGVVLQLLSGSRTMWD